jgi:TusA-related sulfurtransferase
MDNCPNHHVWSGHTGPSPVEVADPANFMQTVDCRGLKCPMPIVQVRLALNALRKDAELLIYADDPTFETDFSRFCYLADLRLLSKTQHPDFQAYHVKIIR